MAQFLGSLKNQHFHPITLFTPKQHNDRKASTLQREGYSVTFPALRWGRLLSGVL